MDHRLAAESRSGRPLAATASVSDVIPEGDIRYPGLVDQNAGTRNRARPNGMAVGLAADGASDGNRSQTIREMLLAMSHKPMIKLPRAIAWSVWPSIQAWNLARNAWLWAGLNTA